MSDAITFFVPGKPQPAGSKRAFAFKRKNGKLGVSVNDMNPKAYDWKAVLAHEAGHARGVSALMEGPVEIEVWFHMERPKSHFGSGGNAKNLKPNAPSRPTSAPDTTKLVRCLEDALTGVVWKDDAQIVSQHCHKVYADEYGVHVTIRDLSNGSV